jgi:hypothetical protein
VHPAERLGVLPLGRARTTFIRSGYRRKQFRD